MNNEGEFQNCKIDTDCTIDQDLDCEIDLKNIDVNKVKCAKQTRSKSKSLDN